MKKNILAGITAIAVVLSTGVIAFAATDTAASPANNGPLHAREARSAVMESLMDSQREAIKKAGADIMKEALNALVDNGTITQDQADQMDQNHTDAAPANLTAAQKEAVTQSVTAAAKEALTNLVEKGVLTQEEADGISVEPRMRPNGKEAFNILSEDQLKALHEMMNSKWENSLAELVDHGTITQDQADQLLNEKGGMFMGPGGMHGFGGHHDFEDEEKGTDL